VLNRLWRVVKDRFNYLTPTKKPVMFGTGRNGRRTRHLDQPTTPLQRLLAAKVPSPTQQAELLANRDDLNPAKLAREIADLQTRLLVPARDKTEQLHLPTALPASAQASELMPPDHRSFAGMSF